MIGTKSGQPESAAQQLKAVWLRLPEATQDYWREQFASSRTQADIRAEIARKLNVKLGADGKLTKFRAWLEDQDARAAQAERMEENEQRIKDAHPDWNLDRVREEVIRASYFETLASGNHSLGLKTVVQDLNVKKVNLDERRIALLEKKAAAYDRAQATLEEAKKSKGGISKETLTKIEQELRLL